MILNYSVFDTNGHVQTHLSGQVSVKTDDINFTKYLLAYLIEITFQKKVL